MTFDDLGVVSVAWYRSMNPTPAQEALAQERLGVCTSCEERAWAPAFQWWKCSACGCPLHKKIFSPRPGSDACPRGKWVK